MVDIGFSTNSCKNVVLRTRHEGWIDIISLPLPLFLPPVHLAGPPLVFLRMSLILLISAAFQCIAFSAFFK
ncbi:hypothetical protein M405DRAFT_18121 [Rhizopogon salebrosus TDB-379]|nr:hypothetical protein M405DRAFT_18121 [Rhizopogon salebrosus TDB-379]